MLRGMALLFVVAAGSAACSSSDSASSDDPGSQPNPFCPDGVAYPDADGDGVGALDGSIDCGGEHPPAGFVIRSGDCDDTNPTLSRWWTLNDLDGDRITLCEPELETVCGAPDDAPTGASGSTTYPCDCDDSDPSVAWLYYEDRDGDGFGAATGASVCAGNAAPAGFGIWFGSRPDCDDDRADVNQFGLEQWTDDVDSNCDGFLSPYDCDDESCEPEPGPLPIDDSCGGADLRIDVRLFIECYIVYWTVVIGNQGTEAANGFTLTIEGFTEPIIYSIQDPLPPGAQHSYPIPVRELQGDLHFSVTAEGSDCNPDNDEQSASALPRDCTK